MHAHIPMLDLTKALIISSHSRQPSSLTLLGISYICIMVKSQNNACDAVFQIVCCCFTTCFLTLDIEVCIPVV
ncbi:hypothetical protein Tsubulata_046971 [Turnera subulata]|uniref:Uncharacterized protein n=1 Tax=Turnera subulata TaxID=218843 RepID=A0A9Q0F091_9ROSI|nr:hypothetical protein Tsubulata_046971 [Turnera subulata]